MRKYIIPGMPLALKRPRLSNYKFYDSQVSAKSIVSAFLRNQHDDNLIYGCPVCLELIFFMPIPKTRRRKKSSIAGQYHFFKPDIDNLIKLYLDCITDTVLSDDCIISSICAKKIYDENPRTEIIVTHLAEPDEALRRQE